ncbi:MAG: type II toxin-antitoxin system RelE/ParE family toxin [Planctomycetota bacterium]|nr:type II toxin-antitoxin system RelE/ParE family toxin [Planctomycetota bacterium]
MKCILSPLAEAELVDATTYLEARQSNLGLRFLDEYDQTILRIVENPRAWHVIAKHARCCNMHVFPYGVIYSIEEDGIVVLAIMHLHQRPNYWIDRLG